MLCYLCQTGKTVGATHFNVQFAVGICQQCGVGVCLEHSCKASEPGSPLLCKNCAEKSLEVTREKVELVVPLT
jgi:hypothetical protein